MKSIELGAMWKKKDRNGNTYLSGTMNVFPFGTVSIVAFANEKTKDNQPDFKLYYSPQETNAQGVSAAVNDYTDGSVF